MKRIVVAVVIVWLSLAVPAFSQTFSSGSTGADGALDLTSGDRTVQLPDSGILNYTTVNIPVGRALKFALNLRNTPVILLAQGAVNIAGIIYVSASWRTPGPGGFYGGSGGPGFGPGGGAYPGGTGQWIGPLSLVPIIGGSGAGACGNGPDGGGGGGAIVIASSSSVSVSGWIHTFGSGPGNGCSSFGADGASGAVRIVANSISVTGGVTAAIVRLEAPLESLTYSGAGTAPVRSTINPVIVSTAPQPSLDIVSIGGFAVPSYSGSSFNTIDLILPTQLADPIPVVVHASNVPPGSTVTITFSGSPGGNATTGTLTGSLASSTATVTISGLTRSAVTYLFVSTTFPVSMPSSAPGGSEAVAKVRIDAPLGGKPRVAFLRNDGREVARSRVPEALLRQFGQ